MQKREFGAPHERALFEAFKASIQAFLDARDEKRRRSGDILLTNSAMIDAAYQEALYETGVERRPISTYDNIPIIGKD